MHRPARQDARYDAAGNLVWGPTAGGFYEARSR
jgi:hypothetical protein